jgi:chromosome partitioning protein
MTTIAIINLKGGVGKSVTTCNLACNLTETTLREPEDECPLGVLVIDLDKQGNTSKFFGAHDYAKPTVADVLTQKKQLEDVIVWAKCADRTDPEYDQIETGIIGIAPADMRLLTANREVMLDMLHPRHSRLAQALRAVSDDYDFCLIDCPPDIDMGTINALAAADWVLIPVDSDAWALDGLREIMAQVDVIRDEYNPKLRVLGVLRTKVQASASCRRVGEMLDGLPVLDSTIRASRLVPSANNARKPLAWFAPKAGVTADYAALTREVLRRTGALDGAAEAEADQEQEG